MGNLDLYKEYEISVIVREVKREADSIEAHTEFLCGTVGGVKVSKIDFNISTDKERWLEELLKSAMANSRPRLITKMLLNLKEG